MSLLDALRQVKDPRSRQGKIYELWQILAILVLAAMQGRRLSTACGLGERSMQHSYNSAWIYGDIRAW